MVNHALCAAQDAEEPPQQAPETDRALILGSYSGYAPDPVSLLSDALEDVIEASIGGRMKGNLDALIAAWRLFRSPDDRVRSTLTELLNASERAARTLESAPPPPPLQENARASYSPASQGQDLDICSPLRRRLRTHIEDLSLHAAGSEQSEDEGQQVIPKLRIRIRPPETRPTGGYRAESTPALGSEAEIDSLLKGNGESGRKRVRDGEAAADEDEEEDDFEEEEQNPPEEELNPGEGDDDDELQNDDDAGAGGHPGPNNGGRGGRGRGRRGRGRGGRDKDKCKRGGRKKFPKRAKLGKSAIEAANGQQWDRDVAHTSSHSSAVLISRAQQLVDAFAPITAPSSTASLIALVTGVCRSDTLSASANTLSLPIETTADSLAQLGKSCWDAEANSTAAVFSGLIHELKFSMGVHRIMLSAGKPFASKTAALKDVRSRMLSAGRPVTLSKLERWESNGMRWALVIMAGSLPALLAIATLGLKERFRTARNSDISAWASALKMPSLFEGTDHIAHIVIPELLRWQACFSLQVGERVFGEDLDTDEAYLQENMDFHLWTLPKERRCFTIWRHAQAPLLAPRIRLFAPLPADVDLEVRLAMWRMPSIARTERLASTFTPAAVYTAPFSHGTAKSWTEAQRALAKEYIQCRTVGELQDALEEQQIDSSGSVATPYLRFSAADLTKDGTELVIESPDGAPYVVVIPSSSIPDSERAQFHSSILSLSCVDPKSVPVDSESALAKEQGYPCLHLNWTNRFSEMGDDPYPERIHARSSFLLDGNISGRLPRESKAITEDRERYEDMSAFMEKICMLVAERVDLHFPEHAQRLREYIDTLPLAGFSPAAPFAGFVVNLGGCAIGHSDHDLGLCVAVVFGDFLGGELALYECKLLIETQGFTIIAFLSRDLTHFNLPFKGSRISIILQTEREAESWVQVLNQWATHLM